jgi:hypothetical protein
MTRSHHLLPDLHAGPPPEVLEEIEAAWERAQALTRGELELRFAVDPDARRAHGELRCTDGTLVRRLSALETLLHACGEDDEQHAYRLAV